MFNVVSGAGWGWAGGVEESGGVEKRATVAPHRDYAQLQAMAQAHSKNDIVGARSILRS